MATETRSTSRTRSPAAGGAGTALAPPPCPVCRGERLQVLPTPRGTVAEYPGDSAYHQCDTCGAIALLPLPGADACQALYGYGRLDAQRLDEHRQRIAGELARTERRSRFSWLPLARYAYDEYLFRRSPGKILDIGCGGGTLLLRFARRGWQIFGVDYDTTAIQALNTFFRGRFQDRGASTFDFPERFDLIVMSHIIEHLPHPVDALRHVKGYLAESWELVVTTPDVDSLGRLLFGSRWFYYGAQHILLHGRISIERVLREAGYTIRRVEKLGTPAEYALSLRRRPQATEYPEASLWERVLWLLPALSAAWLGRGAEMRVVASA